MRPKLSIIIVSWNVRHVLLACLRSIQVNKGPNRTEIIVVESASTDDTIQAVRAQFPTVRLLTQTENVGFVRGNNIGFAAAQGEYLLMLNPDTEVIGDALTQMIAHLDATPEVGIVGPHTLNSDGSTQSTKRRFPTIRTGLFESTWLQPFAPRGLLDRFYARDISDTATAEVDWVQGSALLFRRAVYEQIGGLDEGYAMYSEELDFCKRARDAGWKASYLGNAQVIHHGGKSTEQASTRTQIYFQRSKLRYFRKHQGWLAAGVIRLVLILSYLQQTIAEAFKGVIGHKRALRWGRVRAYRQVIRALILPENPPYNRGLDERSQ